MTDKITVIGGSGFIGRRLVERLLGAGHNVRIVDKSAVPPYAELTTICDVRDASGLQRACAGTEIIYHLAAEHRDDVRPIQLYYDVNVQGARNICQAAEGLGLRRLLYVSSVAVYGFAAAELTEAAETHPFNEYGRTKLAAEEIFRAWAAQAPERSLTIIRPTAVFGEGNRGNVYNLLNHLAKKRFFMVGNGRNQKSIAYVENVAAFLEFCLQFGAGVHLYNYADKPDFDMNTLIRLVQSKLGQPAPARWRLPYHAGYAIGLAFDCLGWLLRRRFPISAVRVRKFCENSRFSAAKARAAGFTPPVSLEEGLVRMIKTEFDVNNRDSLIASPSTAEKIAT